MNFYVISKIINYYSGLSCFMLEIKVLVIFGNFLKNFVIFEMYTIVGKCANWTIIFTRDNINQSK